MSTEAVLNTQETQTISNQKQDQGSTEQNDQLQRRDDQDLPDPGTCEENDEATKNDIIETVTTTNEEIKKEQSEEVAEEEPQRTLKKVKSEEELKIDFKQNQKMLTTLSFNIDDLFKKISSLTEQVQSQIGSKPLSSAKSIDKIDSPRKKYEPLAHKSEKLIQLKQPKLETKFSYDSRNSNEDIHKIQQKGVSMRMFEIGQSLGYGKFGQVVQCKHKETGSLFALKKIFKSTIEQYNMADQLFIELQACKRMNHPNIIKSYLSFTDDFHIFLITQYALGCKLTKKFNSIEEDVSKIICQVLDALKFMHSQGVVHRDLKPQNILIDQAGTIKICDFGWSSLITEEQKMNILCGTLDYVSPEMVAGEVYTKEVDLWSVGVLTYELIFGTAPFKAQNKAGTFQNVKKLQYNFPGSYRFSQQCLDFMTKLLKPEPERMRIQECIVHPFITTYQKAEKWNSDFDILFE